MKKTKKGISAIVATVLIILITVAAITIIWAAIIPMINGQLKGSTECFDAVRNLEVVSDFTCQYPAGHAQEYDVNVQVGHGAEDVNLDDIQILLIDGSGNTAPHLVMDTSGVVSPNSIPGSNERRTYLVSLASGVYDEVKVAPIITVGQTSKTCDASAAITISACP